MKVLCAYREHEAGMKKVQLWPMGVAFLSVKPLAVVDAGLSRPQSLGSLGQLPNSFPGSTHHNNLAVVLPCLSFLQDLLP